MEYEIDFLPVGKESKSGDAILLRYGNLDGSRAEQTFVVVDGGFSSDGEEVINHIRKYYDPTSDRPTIDLVVSTHPHDDHIQGLSYVLENADVEELWMHKAWEHSEGIQDELVKDTSQLRIRERLQKSLQSARDLETLANRLKIPIVEPFAGLETTDGVVQVLGPSEAYYEELLAAELDGKSAGLAKALVSAAKRLLKRIQETWDQEKLTDPEADAVTPINNSSAILLIRPGNGQLLLTADSGVPAITNAIEYAETLDVDLTKSSMQQMPHHGSKRNVGPTLLNELLGEPVPDGNTSHFSAIVSAAKEGTPKHPSQRVVNGFIRRGAKVVSTQGSTLRHHSSGAPDRGWGKATSLEFQSEYDEEE